MKANDQIHWPSVLQLGFSLAAALACFMFAAVFALGGAGNLLGEGGAAEQATSLFVMAANAGLGGLLLLPSAGYALLRLLNWRVDSLGWIESFFKRAFRPAYLILLLPIVLLLGYLVSQSAQLSWLFLPSLHLLAVGLPVFFLASLGWRGLPRGSNQRAWGIFGVGLILGPGLILFLELAVLAAILILGLFYVLLNPALVEEINALAFRLQFLRDAPDEALRLLMPYLARPPVVFTIFTYTAVIVPFIEELVKPLGAWFLVGSRITPAEGFTAGLLSGAGYALFENLALSTVTGNGWSGVVISRIGTGLLHILTPALTGWALALAWREGRYLRLGLTYLGVVLVHGVWNGLALLTAANNLLPAGAAGPLYFSPMTRIAAAGLGLIALVMFIVLILSNAVLRRRLELAGGAGGEHARPVAAASLPPGPQPAPAEATLPDQTHPQDYLPRLSQPDAPDPLIPQDDLTRLSQPAAGGWPFPEGEPLQDNLPDRAGPSLSEERPDRDQQAND